MNTLYIVASASGEGLANRLSGELGRAWPRGDAPAIGVGTPEQTMARLAGGAKNVGVLFLVDETMEPVQIDMMLDQFMRQSLPAIVYTNDCESLGSIEASGILVESGEIVVGGLAVMLDTLMRRQGALCEIARDAKLAMASAHGLAEELRHVHEEMEMAAGVQRDILPKRLPKIDGLDSGLLFRPASQVSGDIYDMTVLDDGRVGVFIADAVGHGMPAALLTMLVAHHLAKSQLRGRDIQPARVLDELNRAMCERRFDTPRFATAVYAVIDPRTGEMAIAGAGHPPALRIRGGISTQIESRGPLLGIFDEAEFEQASMRLEIGETLALYSDGFETAFPCERMSESGRPLPSEDYQRQLQNILGGGRDVEEAIETLEGRVGEQAGSLHQADDLTALVIRRVACAERAIAA